MRYALSAELPIKCYISDRGVLACTSLLACPVLVHFSDWSAGHRTRYDGVRVSEPKNVSTWAGMRRATRAAAVRGEIPKVLYIG